MQDFVIILFWCSSGLIFHNYFGFWLTVRILTLFKWATPNESLSFVPSMTVIIPAHNEEAIIAQKLDTVISQDYPKELLEIIVASDVSTDKTNEIVSGYEPKGVTLIAFSERHGKIGALDEIVPKAKGEVVVITDANVLLAPEALKRLAAEYSDPGVGAVSGYQTVEIPGSPTRLQEEVVYRTFEANLKKHLSKLGLMVGAFGGFYSLRRKCFRPIGSKPKEDDVIHPLQAIAQGYKSKFASDAIGYEEIGSTMHEEYRRRIRMTAYNLNATGLAIKLGARGGLLALYVVLSYKILRWLTPFLWIILAISSLFLLKQGPLYLVIGSVVLVGIGSAFIGMIVSAVGGRIGFFSNAYYFAVMNFASLPGVLLWMRGVKRFWAPRAGLN